MNNAISGTVLKMETKPGNLVEYTLPIGAEKIPLNPLLGRKAALKFLGNIACVHCGRKIKKTFNQGYCFPCSQTLARCDMCIVRPELCHYAAGTCREPAWGESHCLIPHTVYLANSSGVKVGITRTYQQKTRWMDQGALFALPLGEVSSRLDSGLVEVALKKYVSDKTNWRNMLKNDVPEVDLSAIRETLIPHWPTALRPCLKADAQIVAFNYPVLEYPKKINSHNLDKTPLLEGVLLGIKGQYLIFDKAVINMRKYAGYELEFSSEAA